MGTLTVANLLPADLDPESFRGGALQTFLDRLKVESEQVRVAVFRHLEQDLRSATGLQGVSGLNLNTTSLPSDSLEFQVIACINAVIDLQGQVRETEAKIAVTKAVHDLESQVQDFRHNLGLGKYREAAWALLQLKKISEDGRAGAVGSIQQGAVQRGVGNIESMLEWCSNTLAQQLQEDCAALVQASPEHRYLSVRQLTVRGASLAELWGTLALTQQLELHMRPLAEGLVAQVVHPLLQEACRVSTSHYDASVTSSSDGSASGPVALLQWVPQQQGCEAGRAAHSANSALEACRHTLGFLVHSLCGAETEAVQVFGSLAWPLFTSSYLECLVHPLLSHTQPATEDVEQLLAASVQLEQHAASLGLIPSHDSSLSSAVDGLIRGSVHDRRQKYLAAARQLLSDRHETIEVGGPLSTEALILFGLGGEDVQDALMEGLSMGVPRSGPMLSEGYYHIPRGISQLVQLIEDAVIEAASGSSSDAHSIEPTTCNTTTSNSNTRNTTTNTSNTNSSSSTISNFNSGNINSSSSSGGGGGGCGAAAKAVHSAVEGVVVLVQQLVACQCGVGCPGQLLLVQCNGLQYLAGQLMLLPVRGGAALKKACPLNWFFPDQLLALRQLHMQLLSLLIHAEVASLLELLPPLLQPWRPSSAQADIAQRKAVSQVTHSLARLGKALLAVAPVDTLVRVAAGVLSGLCTHVVEYVLERDDIGAEESSQLGGCLHTLMEEALKGLLQAGQPLSSRLERSGTSLSMVREAVLQGAGSFRKLLCLCAMLDAKLIQIVEWWEEGRLTGAGLQAGEVHHLVRALFEDNEHRRRCLQRIRI